MAEMRHRGKRSNICPFFALIKAFYPLFPELFLISPSELKKLSPIIIRRSPMEWHIEYSLPLSTPSFFRPTRLCSFEATHVEALRNTTLLHFLIGNVLLNIFHAPLGFLFQRTTQRMSIPRFHFALQNSCVHGNNATLRYDKNSRCDAFVVNLTMVRWE